MKTFQQKPYFDDFDETKKFYRVNFRPSIPVQCRELNQIQSIMQNQIKRFGDNIFTNGAKIYNGELTIDNTVFYVKLESLTSLEREAFVGLVGHKLKGETSGAVAEVLAVVEKETRIVANVNVTDPDTLMVRFVASGTDGEAQTFVSGENIVVSDFTENDTLLSATFTVLDDTNAVGNGSIASIADGIYYIYGYFALVSAQTIILEKYSPHPSFRVGLNIKETMVTADDDSSLNDNAVGSNNYAAPGAHRYKIDLELIKVLLGSTIDEDNFIELGEVVEGNIVKIVETTDYSTLATMDVLAHRTYDESGDYTVNPFKLSLYEHRSNNCGYWSSGKHYIQGDIVKNSDDNIYIALTSGVSGFVEPTGRGEAEISDGNLKWEYTTEQVFNDGLYDFEGSITKVNIENGGSGYTTIPKIVVTGSNNGEFHDAKMTAVLTDGSVTGVKIDDKGNGYSKESTVVVTVDNPYSGDDRAEVTATANFGDDDKFVAMLDKGKAYVRGYEVETAYPIYLPIDKARVDLTSTVVGTNGSTTEEVTIPHSSEAKQAYLSTNIGNYILVEVASGIPPVDTLAKVELWNSKYDSAIGASSEKGKKIGTARIRAFEYQESETKYDGTNAQIFRAYIFDYNLDVDETYNSFQRDVKSLRYSDSSSQGISNSFFANIIPTQNVDTKIQGTVSKSANSAVINGNGTTFSDLIFKYDSDTSTSGYGHISIGNDPSEYLVHVDNNIKLTLLGKDASSGLYTKDFTSENGYAVRAFVNSQQKVSNVFALPHSYIKDVVLEANSKELSYTVKEVVPAESISGNTATFNSFAIDRNCTTVTILGNEVRDFVFFNNSGIIDPSTVVSISNDTATGVTNTITVRFSSNPTASVKCIASVAKTYDKLSAIRTKTLVKGVSENFSVNANTRSVQLAHTDGYKLNSVYLGANDVTDWFEFDNGQTAVFYGLASVSLKNNSYKLSSGTLTVNYDYFAHNGSGDCYIKSSYPNEINSMTEIPSFNGVSLRDCVDFRPDVNEISDSGVSTLARNSGISLYYSYYYGRKDRICVDPQGNFVDVRGIPSDDPKLPEIPALSMCLYNIELKPYTEKVDSENIIVEMVDNKRYTMRDIGKLEERINTLEELTTLSLLEQQTASMLVLDEDGNDRFKNGFVVDNFTTQLLANDHDNGYNCAIDVENGLCRPSFVTHSIDLVEDSNNRSNINYAISGKVITLPRLDDVLLVSQTLASRTENVNPYAVATFYGTMTCNPSTDDWFENVYKDDKIISVEGNYSLVKSSAEGIKWNDWQNTWTGATQVTGRSTQMVGKDRDYWNDGWGSYTEHTNYQNTTYYAQTQGQTRTGTKKTVTARTDYEEIGDKIVSTSEIKNMRSRYLMVKAKGLKPYTKFYPYFDDVEVSYWCTPCSIIRYTPTNGTFDDSTLAKFETEGITGVSNDYIKSARQIETTQNSFWSDATDKTCLDVGDVIAQKVSGGIITAVVCGVAYTNMKEGETSDYYLYVTNIKFNGKPTAGRFYSNDGTITNPSAPITFQTGKVITGSLSGATGTVVSAEPNLNHIWDSIVSNGAGEVYFMYWIPNGNVIDYTKMANASATKAFYFKCGERVVGVSDDPNVDNGMAETTYSAVGVLNTRQKVVNAVRNAQIVTSTVSENRTVTNNWSDTNITSTSRAVNLDPLAETFLVSNKGGCFLSKVGIFFAQKDDNLPITLQIRTVENGYPTNKVLAFANVVKNPSDILISSVNVSYTNDNGKVVSYPNYDSETFFEFESPVYVEDNTEYAVILLTNSTKYRVWTARVGDVTPVGTVISKQPYNGVLFKSQNGTAWTADQNQDLMFEIYRCEFDISYTGDVEFVNPSIKPVRLTNDPFETTKNSATVTVYHENHGLTNDKKARFYYDNLDAVNGANVLFGSKNIEIASGATRINSTTSNTSCKFLEQLSVGDTLLYRGEVLGVVASVTSNSSLTFVSGAKRAKPISLVDDITFVPSLNGIPIATVTDARGFTIDNATINTYTVDFAQYDSTVKASASGFTGKKYFCANRIINYDVIQPTINYQSFTETSIGVTVTTALGHSVDETSSTGTSLSLASVAVNENNYFANPMAVIDDTNSSSKSLRLNIKMNSSNSALSPIIDTERVSAILINNTVNCPMDAETLNAELEPLGGSVYSKYITKEIVLTSYCKMLKVAFAYNKPLGSYIDVYYKAFASNSDSTYDTTRWVKMTPSSALVDTNVGSSIMRDATFTKDNIGDFDRFAIKVAFRSSNSSAVPCISQLRVIACE